MWQGSHFLLLLSRPSHYYAAAGAEDEPASVDASAALTGGGFGFDVSSEDGTGSINTIAALLFLCLIVFPWSRPGRRRVVVLACCFDLLAILESSEITGHENDAVDWLGLYAYFGLC
nr:hypothetical protein Iba_chr02fCG13080 [Ipomoea batatas]